MLVHDRPSLCVVTLNECICSCFPLRVGVPPAFSCLSEWGECYCPIACRDFDFAAQKKMDILVNMNMHEDAVVIINAIGTILMVSQVRDIAQTVCRVGLAHPSLLTLKASSVCVFAALPLRLSLSLHVHAYSRCSVHTT